MNRHRRGDRQDEAKKNRGCRSGGITCCQQPQVSDINPSVGFVHPSWQGKLKVAILAWN